MKTLNEIEVLLTEKVMENKGAIQEYANKIEDAEKESKRADADLLAAETEIDVDKYNTAKNSIWSAKHAKELYKKQKDKLESVPLISKPEYNQLLSDITTAADSIHEEQNSRAVELLRELKDIAEESSETWAQADKLIHILQYDVYKDADRTVLVNGNIVTRAKEYKNNNTVHNFYNYNIKRTALAEQIEQGSNQSTQKYWG